MKRERARLFKLYDLSIAVPFPKDGSGSSTVSMSGMVTYQADMRQYMGAMRLFYQAVLMEDRLGVVEGEDYTNPDHILLALEAWIKDRQAHDWDQSVPEFSSYLKMIEADNQVS